MGLIDFILNLAGLLLWLGWRSVRFDPLGKRMPATLIGTLRRAEPARWQRWHLLAMLGGLLLLRALFYWQIGSASKPVWAGTLNLGIIMPAFLGNSFGRMLLFSVLSFALALGVFYLGLLFLSLLADPMSEPGPVQRLVRVQLGAVDRWSRGVKLCLPLIVTALLWWAVSWPLMWLQIIPRPVSAAHRIEQALLIGLGSYLFWKYLVAGLLVLHLLSTYVYFGKHPFWTYIGSTALTLLKPVGALSRAVWKPVALLLLRLFSWRMEPGNSSPALKITRAVLLDVAGIALAFLVAALAEWGLSALYARLPL